MSGPQADRSKAMAAGKLPTGSRDDILSADRGTDKFAFEGELGRLRRENSTLKEQLQRSLKELKAYQTKYPSAYINVPRSDGEHDQLPPWASSPDIMKPLFEAYDTRIKEMESVIHHQTEQLRMQTGSVSTPTVLFMVLNTRSNTFPPHLTTTTDGRYCCRECGNEGYSNAGVA